MKSFLVQLLVLTALVVATGYGLRAGGYGHLIHPQAGALVAFFAVLTFFTYRLVERGRQGAPENLTGYLLGAQTTRLLLSMGVAVAFIMRGIPGRETFLGAFFLLYFLYAGFEVWHILRNLRPDSE